MRLCRIFTLGTLHCLLLGAVAHGGTIGTNNENSESHLDPDSPRHLLPSCEDRPDSFRFKGNMKDCEWVGKNRPFRCLISAARETCPHTCRTCEPLVMTPYIFGRDDLTAAPSADPTKKPRTPAPTERPTRRPASAPSAPPSAHATSPPTALPSALRSTTPTVPRKPPPSSLTLARPTSTAQNALARGDAAATTGRPTPGARNAQVLVAVLLDIINGTRTAFGLAQFAASSAIEEQAQRHARAMADDRLLRYSAYAGGPATRWIGEIVGRGPSFEDINKFLFESVEHRRTVLSPVPNTLGLAVAIDEEGTLWTCLILERR